MRNYRLVLIGFASTICFRTRGHRNLVGLRERMPSRSRFSGDVDVDIDVELLMVGAQERLIIFCTPSFACYDGGIPFLQKWFLNDGAP